MPPDGSPSYPLTTTTALLHSLQGDEGGPAWDAFVARYAPILRAVARRLGLGPEDAADATQQALLEFVRDMRGGRFDRSRGRLRSWILTIVEHRARDIQRLARSRGIDQQIPLGPEEGAERMDRWWEEEERAHIANLAWATVSASGTEDARSVRAFELLVLRGVPAAEVARELGTTVEAVYAAKYRVARRMRETVARLSAAFREDEA